MDTSSGFDPSRYLTRVNGSEYLEVKWRLVWLRDQHPDADIHTELVTHGDDFALFRAKVTLPSGATATGWGSERLGDFKDYIEKAETKAIGRALAALGFGTQFCPDFEFGAARGKVVDAPIDFSTVRGNRHGSASPEAKPAASHAAASATTKQLKFIEAIAREAKLSAEDLEKVAQEAFGGSTRGLSRQDASSLIEHLQARLTGSALAS
jgi:hypothetical protein